MSSLPTFDILEDIKQRLGFRLSLDHLAQETLGRKKTGHGLQAIEWFRKGDIDKLHSYCKEDVDITRELFEYGFKNGHLIYRQKTEDRRLRLPVDWKIEEIIQRAKERIGEH
ncbi:MAG: hypothetical protein DRH15_13585 [Deltaproteobacteria bacterium]|nr:MAG: hypothetical protein DRH15_13585 [Deltaproteobacteria bacterium]